MCESHDNQRNKQYSKSVASPWATMSVCGRILKWAHRPWVGWVECAELLHSPSCSTNPKGLQVECDLELWECLCEDVCGHFFHWTILDIDLLVRNSLSNKMVAYIDVFGPHMIIVVCGEMEHSLIVAEKGGGRVKVPKQRANESSQPDAFFHYVSSGDVFGLGGG